MSQVANGRKPSPPPAAAPAAQKPEREMEYVPFAAESPIKLSINIVREFIAVRTKSGATPDDTQIIKFMMLCKARRLNPFEGDAYLVGYDTKDGPQYSLITAHQAFLKRAEVNPEYDGMESGVMVMTQDGAIIDREGDFFLDDERLVGAWARVYFKKRSHPMVKRLSLKAFQKPYGVWRDNPAGMIVKCAEADALRSSFPTMLGSLYLEDEIVPANAGEAAANARAAIPNGRTSMKRTAEITSQQTAPTPSFTPSIQNDGEIIGRAEPVSRPAQRQADTFTAASPDQLDEIDATLPNSGLTQKEAIAGLLDTSGSPIVSIAQLSQEQASTVLKRIQDAIEAQAGRE